MFARPQRQTGKNESVGWTHSFCGVVRIWGILFLILAWGLGGTDVWDGKPQDAFHLGNASVMADETAQGQGQQGRAED